MVVHHELARFHHGELQRTSAGSSVPIVAVKVPYLSIDMVIYVEENLIAGISVGIGHIEDYAVLVLLFDAQVNTSWGDVVRLSNEPVNSTEEEVVDSIYDATVYAREIVEIVVGTEMVCEKDEMPYHEATLV